MIFFSYCIYEGRDEWQEKFGYILSYLEQPKDYSDSPSTTTETSDSGMPRPHSGAASELGMKKSVVRYARYNKIVTCHPTVSCTNALANQG